MYIHFSDQSLHSMWHRKMGRSEGVFGLFMKPWLRKKKKEKLLCSPVRAASLPQSAVFVFFCLTLILTNWLVRETVLLTATVGPQTDVKLTAGRQQESPLPPPSDFFLLDRMWENSPPFMWKTSKDRGPIMRLDPNLPLHLPPPFSPQVNPITQKGTHVTWMFDKLKK